MQGFRSVKVSLVGAGNIGGSLAYMLGTAGIARELVLVDVAADTSLGKSLDIGQALGISGMDVSFVGDSDYAAVRDSDVVVVTAGIPRKEGMSREDLLSTNASVVKKVAEGIGKYAPNAFVIVVTNPLDSMAWCMYKHSGLPVNRVVGMAGVLDSARFSFFLAQRMRVSLESVFSLVLGGHGDLMLPLLRYSTVAGVSVAELIEDGSLSKEDVAAIVERTRGGGEEIVKLLKSGSAYWAPAASCMSMIEAYVYDKRVVLPCSVHLNGQYGMEGVFVGVPVVVGKAGIEEILELELTAEERKTFEKSVEIIRESIALLS